VASARRLAPPLASNLFPVLHDTAIVNMTIGKSSQTPFRRKNIRLPAENYLGRRMYFLTLCFEDRKPFGKNPRVASWLIEHLRAHAAGCRFFVHAYCVMPDHMHAFVCAASDASSLMSFVEEYKQQTGFVFAQRTRRKLWQFKYYDRILRNSDSAEAVAWYVWLNPVRKGLCNTPFEYPFVGAFTEIGAKILQGSQAPAWKPPWKA
jgi:REP element-mobilizing transposase RayT